MQHNLSGFNFITPNNNRSGRGPAGKSGLQVKAGSRGSGAKSIVFTIYKDLMKKSGIVIGDRVNLAVKRSECGIRYVFIQRSPDGAYAVSGLKQYRGKTQNGQVKMSMRTELSEFDGFKCEVGEVQFLDDGGFLAND